MPVLLPDGSLERQTVYLFNPLRLLLVFIVWLAPFHDGLRCGEGDPFWAQRLVTSLNWCVGVYQGGPLSVTIFFVLSGYLVTKIMLTDKDHGLPMWMFIMKRTARILPPFYMMLLAIMYGIPFILNHGDQAAKGLYWTLLGASTVAMILLIARLGRMLALRLEQKRSSRPERVLRWIGFLTCSLMLTTVVLVVVHQHLQQFVGLVMPNIEISPMLRVQFLGYCNLPWQAWIYCMNLHIIYLGAEPVYTTLIGHTWSLCVEEHFYLLMPIIIYCTPREYLSRLFTILIFISLADHIRCTYFINSPDKYYGTLINLFPLSCAAWIAVNEKLMRLPNTKTVVFMVGTIGFVIFVNEGGQNRIIDELGRTMLGVLVVMICIYLNPIVSAYRVFAPLRAKVMQEMGAMSYGLYLFHEPVFKFFNVLKIGKLDLVTSGVKMGLVVLIALCSYGLMEQWLIKGARMVCKRRMSAAQRQPIAHQLRHGSEELPVPSVAAPPALLNC